MTQSEALTYERPNNPATLMSLAFLGLIAVAVGAWFATGTVIDGAALAVLIVVTSIGMLIFRRAARGDPEEPILFQTLTLAWMVRLVGMGFKLYIFHVLVGGAADAASYHQEGQVVAELLRAGVLPNLERFWGTSFVELVTGLIYFVTGPTFTGGWIVFNFVGLLGTLLHYKAFAAAAPQGNRRLFMWLMFFAPTLVMWTNEVGKDALSLLVLGMTTYGVANLSRFGLRLSPLTWTLAGLGGVMLVRPQIGPIVVAALTAAFAVLPVRTRFRPIIRLAALTGMAALAIIVVRASAAFLSVEDLSVEGVATLVEERGGENTQVGTLAFSGAGFPRTPRAAALAILTVLFRPFPWETGNVLIMLSGFEGMLLLGLLAYRIKSVGSAIRDARQNSYLAFAAVFILLFVIAFSTISNFGILIRQRAQVLPFLFIWLAYTAMSNRHPSEEPQAGS